MELFKAIFLYFAVEGAFGYAEFGGGGLRRPPLRSRLSRMVSFFGVLEGLDGWDDDFLKRLHFGGGGFFRQVYQALW